MRWVCAAFGALGAGACLATVVTDPFSRLSIVGHPYVASMEDGVIRADDASRRLRVRTGRAHRAAAAGMTAFHVLASRYAPRPRADAEATVDEIIDAIYRLRFDPDKLLLITGDHFSSLFVRNLGVFFYPTLDAHLPASEGRWRNRQLVYLQTLAYALGVFARTDDLTTTIVPTGRWAATCVDFHSYPSDTLYGMLYALAALLGLESGRPAEYGQVRNDLATQHAADQLLGAHRASLTRHYERYRERVFDEARGLVDPAVTMSGAKDIVKRQSSFYDNVVVWKTSQLAMRLGLVPDDPGFLAGLRRRILDVFWLSREGHFLEDLSPESRRGRFYSSDWLIVLATGFLDPADPADRPYVERCVDYIRAERIADPFPIKYQQDARAHREFAVVRLAVPAYGGDSIWSFWGMEYIKTLLLLYRSTGDEGYADEADRHIRSYEAAMVRDRGFPEVFDAEGRLLQTPFYRSVRMAGWVVGFDQVRAMRAAIL